MKPVIAANWKMNLDINGASRLVSNEESIQDHHEIDVILAPASCYLSFVNEHKGRASLAAQTISEFSNGAYTGEVSAQMVKSLGATHTLLGHSERRHTFFETNDMISKKVTLCKQFQLTPILCVGETIEERNAGQLKSIISAQLDVITQYDEFFMVAYEPVWAIGTGETATPEMAEDVHKFIRESVGEGIPILYGGSVNSGNIDGLLDMPNIDGALIGGASLKVDEFTKIMAIAAAKEQVNS